MTAYPYAPKLDKNTPNYQVGAVITNSGQVPGLNILFPEKATILFNKNAATVAEVIWENLDTGVIAPLPLAAGAQAVAVACHRIVDISGGVPITDIYWAATANYISNTHTPI